MEYERLRRTDGARHRLRLCAASALLALAVLLAPVSVVATWVNSQVNDVDRYVRTVSPLARDPAVQKLLIDRVTDGLVKDVDLSRITDALADTLDDRDAPRFLVEAAREWDEQLESGLTAGVRFGVEKVVTSEAFATAWDNINRGAHTVATNVLTGEGDGPLAVRGDTVVLNVGPVVEELQERLIGTTLVQGEDIPGADKSIVLARNDNLSEAQDGARWLGALGPWLPLTVVVLGGLGIWAAPNRRVALMAGAIGTGVMMGALLAGVAVARQICLNAVARDAQTQEAAAAVYDTLVRFLRQAALTSLLTALLVAIAAYLYGPGRGAVAVRSTVARGTGAAGHALARTGATTGPVGPWLRTHRPLTTGAVIGAGGLALLLWSYPTPAVVALLLLLVVVALAAVGVVADTDGAERRLRATPTGTGLHAYGRPARASLSPSPLIHCPVGVDSAPGTREAGAHGQGGHAGRDRARRRDRGRPGPAHAGHGPRQRTGRPLRGRGHPHGVHRRTAHGGHHGREGPRLGRRRRSRRHPGPYPHPPRGVHPDPEGHPHRRVRRGRQPGPGRHRPLRPRHDVLNAMVGAQSPADRVVLVRGGAQGTGVLLGPRHVLTAAHVVRERRPDAADGAPGAAAPDAPPRFAPAGQHTVAVIHPSGSQWVACDVRWRDEKRDLALLEARAEVVRPGYLKPLGRPRWGRVATAQPVQDCQIVGFPQVQRDPLTGEIECDQFELTVLPMASRLRPDVLVGEFTRPPAARPQDGRSPRAGLTGAPVLAGGGLLG
ncbi:trypsin-like peptidase domain-containing protein, partial [Streptomyces sp. NPDC003832]